MIYLQKPNKSIIFTLIFGLISLFTQQTIHVVSVILASMAGTIWSYQEALDGTSDFRRLLGALSFVFLGVYLYINFRF